MADPFRSELEAAHQRIEKMEAEHQERVAKLEAEVARLRQRLIDTNDQQRKTGRTFASLGVLILGVSLAAGIAIAWLTGREVAPPSAPVVRVIELPSQQPGAAFDRNAAEAALDAVKLDDCTSAGARGHARIVFAANGAVSSALVDEGPTKDTSVAHCIEDRYRAVRVPPFTGPPVAVGRAFTAP